MSKAVTSGTWPAISVTPPNLSGLATSNVKWGVPAGGGQSGYVFTGGEVDLKLDGSEFTLGTFTHENFPITGMPQQEFDVALTVTVAFEDGTTADFSFSFHHNETPNVGPAPEDLVDLPTFVSPETVTVDGTEYAVLISGFKQNGQVVRRFVSAENGANSADIVAMFAVSGKPDPVITNVRFKGEVKRTQADEYVEIVNRGTAPADLSGWILGADDAGQDFRFPPGTVLAPGQRIRVYTDENHPEWGGFNYGIKRPIWNDKGDTAVLTNTATGEAVSSFPYGDKKVPTP